jgi:hypothetical protein
MERRAQCRQSIAGRESGVAGSNSHVYKTTSNTDIEQHLNTEVQIPTGTNYISLPSRTKSCSTFSFNTTTCWNFPLVVHTRENVVFVGARYKHVGIHNKAASSYIPET